MVPLPAMTCVFSVANGVEIRQETLYLQKRTGYARTPMTSKGTNACCVFRYAGYDNQYVKAKSTISAAISARKALEKSTLCFLDALCVTVA